MTSTSLNVPKTLPVLIPSFAQPPAASSASPTDSSSRAQDPNPLPLPGHENDLPAADACETPVPSAKPDEKAKSDESDSFATVLAAVLQVVTTPTPPPAPPQALPAEAGGTDAVQNAETPLDAVEPNTTTVAGSSSRSQGPSPLPTQAVADVVQSILSTEDALLSASGQARPQALTRTSQPAQPTQGEKPSQLGEAALPSTEGLAGPETQPLAVGSTAPESPASLSLEALLAEPSQDAQLAALGLAPQVKLTFAKTATTLEQVPAAPQPAAEAQPIAAAQEPAQALTSVEVGIRYNAAQSRPSGAPPVTAPATGSTAPANPQDVKLPAEPARVAAPALKSAVTSPHTSAPPSPDPRLAPDLPAATSQQPADSAAAAHAESLARKTLADSSISDDQRAVREAYQADAPVLTSGTGEPARETPARPQESSTAASPVRQIADAVHAAHAEGRTTLEVRLNPPGLGVVVVRLSSAAAGGEARQLQMEIHAAGGEARALLNQHGRELREALGGWDVKMPTAEPSATPTVRTESRQQYSGNPGHGRNGDPQGGQQGRGRPQDPTEDFGALAGHMTRDSEQDE
jgi:flagellar hook-length control protein FliK